ncbi:MAG: AzlD domain-containing protein [Coriobacteriia bacterium]|nr:AzlD domain-containing protein [Coriobacteriia bacterium]
MNDAVIWTVIAGMAILNFAVRFVPIAVVSRVNLPGPVLRWLSYIPVSVMGALVASEVLRPGGQIDISPANPSLLAAVLTAFVYRFTRSFLGATVAGMATFVFLRSVLGM